MDTEATAPSSALRDSDLVDFAAQGASRRKTSVIVEARRPAVAVPGRLATRLPVTSPEELLPPPASRRANASVLKSAAAAAMHELEVALQKLGLAASARRNDLSCSFVVEVTPTQLRKLARAPAVQAIRCNRMHRRV